MRLRLGFFVLLDAAILVGCAPHEERIITRPWDSGPSARQVRLAEKLEQEGYTIVYQGGRPEAQIAFGPEKEVGAAAEFLWANGVMGIGSYSMYHGSIYVPVEKVGKARRLLSSRAGRDRFPNLDLKAPWAPR